MRAFIRRFIFFFGLTVFLACSCGVMEGGQTQSDISKDSLAYKINNAAIEALDETNYSDSDGKVMLYGTRTNGKDTKNGNWACAKVVTIVLREVGIMKRPFLGVRHVESKLRKWEKIYNEDDLVPGDIIVWVSKTGRDDKKCTGGGNCHVGIVTTNGYFHNSPILNKPVYGGFFSLMGFDFKVGFRPPNLQN